MTYSEFKKKDIICIGDGRLMGRVSDLEIDPADGRIRALVVAGSCGIGGIFHGDKNQQTILWGQIACIGDDVILISPGGCC